MTDSPLSQTQQIGEFFTVSESFPVNLEIVDNDFLVPDQFEFEDTMPELFKMASSMAGSDQDMLERLKMDNQQSPALIGLLDHMNQRMITMLGYLLRYEDDPKHRFEGTEFGGGGIRIVSPHSFATDQVVRAKLFFKAESLAIFCYLRCAASEPDEPTGSYKVTFEFEQILEQDQEHLIRASLHSQSRHLKRRAQQRQQKTDEN